jgi:hypothetical protein
VGHDRGHESVPQRDSHHGVLLFYMADCNMGWVVVFCRSGMVQVLFLSLRGGAQQHG